MRPVALAMGLLAIAPTAVAGKLEKEAIDVGPGIDPPKWTYSTPLDAVPSAVEGKVTARLLIDASGEVRKIKIVSSTDARLTNRTKQMMHDAKYTPAMQSGQTISVWWTENLQFVSVEAEIAAVLACDPSKVDAQSTVKSETDTDFVRPVLLRDALPKPTETVRRHGDGFAVLRCVIDVCGRVDHCEVLASSGRDFAEPAIAAARERIYRPGRQGDKPVAVYCTIRTTFYRS